MAPNEMNINSLLIANNGARRKPTWLPKVALGNVAPL
jgi:hypothetical protein